MWRAVVTRSLEPAILHVRPYGDPGPRVEVECRDAAHSYNLAEVLAGTAAIGIRCDDDGLSKRVHTIVLIGAPIQICWAEQYGQVIPIERGARLVRRTQPEPGAIPIAATAGDIL